MYCYSIKKLYTNFILFFLFYTFMKNDRANGSDNFTSTESSVIQITTLPYLTSTFVQSTNPASTTKSSIEKNVISNIPSVIIPLADQSLTLKISAREKTLDFTVTVKKVQLEKSHKISFSSAKRLLIAFENDNFNVDVVSLPFTNDTQIGFANNVEDLVWNKRNGILLPDTVQDYKFIASGAEKNGSQFFLTFQRNWMTCDKQDIQFLLVSFKIWWLIDTKNENNSLAKGEKQALSKGKMLEKQIASESPIRESSTSTIMPSISPTTQRILTGPTTLTTSTGPKNASNSSKPSKGKGNDFDNANEVEVLKSIAEYNFNGPLNESLSTLLQNSSSIYLKGCHNSATIFRCNSNSLKTLGITNANILQIWRVYSNSDSTEKLPEYQIESCNSALDYIKVANKLSKGFLGNRMPKSHSLSKNNGISNMLNNTTKIMSLLIAMAYVLSY